MIRGRRRGGFVVGGARVFSFIVDLVSTLLGGAIGEETSHRVARRRARLREEGRAPLAVRLVEGRSRGC